MRIKDHALLLLTMVVWAGSFVFIKIGLKELDAFNLAFYRFALASPLLLLLVYFSGRLATLSRRDILRVCLLALTGVTLLYVVQFVALGYTTATNASILINTSVVFVALMGFLSGERVGARRAVGVAISFIGVMLIVSKGSVEFFTSRTFVGDTLMVFDGFLWAIYTVVGKEMLEKYSSEALTAYVFVLGTIFLFPFAAYSGLANPLHLQTETLVSILYLSILCSVFAYVVWYDVLEKADSVSVSVYIYLIPLFTAVIAFFALDEVPDAFTVMGGAMTLAGVYLAASDLR